MSKPKIKTKVTGRDAKLQTAQRNLERILEIIEPYSRHPGKSKDEPQMPWVKSDQNIVIERTDDT